VSLHVARSGAGPDLVLLHGWGLHSGVWAQALPALAARFRVHAVDLPGHGHSSGANASSFDEAADAVARSVPRAAVICGWSMGGLLAQRIAMRHPQSARALVLVSSTPCFMARSGWPHGMAPATLEAFADGLHRDREATLMRFVRLNALHGAGERESVRAFTRCLAERDPPTEAALAAGLRWLREVDLRDEARGLPRTLVIHGIRDVLAPIEAGRWLAHAVPGAESLELPDAAHIPFFTHREPFLKAVETFVG
jgi:pimeloyl-[acyl-carrier protein] methyl ester esterase